MVTMIKQYKIEIIYTIPRKVTDKVVPVPN